MISINKYNRQPLISEGFYCLTEGLLFFVKECIKNNKINFISCENLNGDPQTLLNIIINNQENLVLNQETLNSLRLVKDIRNQWMHQSVVNPVNKINDYQVLIKISSSLMDMKFLLEKLNCPESIIQEIDGLKEESLKLLKTLEYEEKNKVKNHNEFSNLIEDKTENFIGRQFVFKAINEFITTQNKGYFIIEGPPGIGKTSILAKYTQNTGCIGYFNIRGQGTNRANHFLDYICKQLINRYSLPYLTLPGEAYKDSSFLVRLLQESINKLGADKNLIIAVDALDEVDSTDHNDSNILYLPESLPNNVYFILTKRQLDISLKVNVPIIRFSLMQFQQESLEDIKNYIKKFLESPKVKEWQNKQNLKKEELIQQLATKSENNFMYIRFILQDIEQGKFTNLGIESLPQGLEDYYAAHWKQMGMMQKPLPRHKIEIVYVLAELRSSVSCQDLSDFTKIDTITIQEVLDEWEQFLEKKQIEGETCYSIYHQSFCDFLARKDIVKAAGIDKKNINAQIANNLIQGMFDDE